jgi:uncharacterized membrane protein YkvA (DUF1232 family)
VAKHIENFKSWSETIASDVDAIEKLVEAPTADGEARRLAAGALNYLVMRLDLVPDHEQGIGALDDVMVLRVCAQLASGHGLGSVDEDAEIALSRLSNEADQISAFLGTQAYDKLRQYCVTLADLAVRGRTPGQVLADEAVRKALYAEVDVEIKKTVPVIITDAEDAELRLKAYLTHKLK